MKVKRRLLKLGGLERMLPPNVDPESTAAGLLTVLAGGVLTSVIWFLIRYCRSYQSLYIIDQVTKKRMLDPGMKMESFSAFAGCAGWLLVFFVCMLLAWAGILYGSFSQGSRSLYLLRRLPQGRRVLAGYVAKGPLLCLAEAGTVCAVLLGIYYLVWRFVTPDICLPM